jgi:hypothetical protein
LFNQRKNRGVNALETFQESLEKAIEADDLKGMIKYSLLVDPEGFGRFFKKSLIDLGQGHLIEKGGFLDKVEIEEVNHETTGVSGHTR